MARNYFTETFDREHIHFGGMIYPSDFNTDYRGKDQWESSIAARIESDMRWEKKLVLQSKRKGLNKTNAS